MKTLILYSTLGCHLCDVAKELTWPVLRSRDFRLQEVDIADSEALVEKYGIRIPVLLLEDANAELAWPFDAEDVCIFLDKTLSTG